MFLTPQPRGNCIPGLAFDLQCLVLQPGEFGVSCCCAKLPPFIKCSGMARVLQSVIASGKLSE